MKSPFLTLTFALSALAGGIMPTLAASLKPIVIIEGETVRVGDIFDDAGQHADIVVINAPAPGRRLTLDSNWLAEAARIYKVAWRPLSRADRVVIERASKAMTSSEILGALRRELVRDGMPPQSVIDLNNRNIELNIPVELPASIDVRNLNYDLTTGRFSAMVVGGGDQAGSQRMMVQGRTFPASPVPVLRRAIGSGEIIRKEDFEVVYRREDQLPRDIITDTSRLIGTTPRSRLRAGEPVRESETRAPTMVTRNSPVVIRLQSGAMTLTAQGRALDEGARGDVIRVMNMQSNKTVEATVAGPDVVTIGFGARLATIN